MGARILQLSIEKNLARAPGLKQVLQQHRNRPRAQATIPARNLANELVDSVHRLQAFICRKAVRVARFLANEIELHVADRCGLQHDHAGGNVFFAANVRRVLSLDLLERHRVVAPLVKFQHARIAKPPGHQLVVTKLVAHQPYAYVAAADEQRHGGKKDNRERGSAEETAGRGSRRESVDGKSESGARGYAQYPEYGLGRASHEQLWRSPSARGEAIRESLSRSGLGGTGSRCDEHSVGRSTRVGSHSR